MSILPEPAWFRNLADSPGDDSPVEASAASPLQTSDEHPDIAEARRIIDKIRATGVQMFPVRGCDSWSFTGPPQKIDAAFRFIPDLRRLHPHLMAVLRAEQSGTPEGHHPVSIPPRIELPTVAATPEAHSGDRSVDRIRHDLQLAIHWQRLWTTEVRLLKERLQQAEEGDPTRRKPSLLDRFFRPKCEDAE